MRNIRLSGESRVFEFRLSQKPGCEVSSEEKADQPDLESQAESILELGIPVHWRIPPSKQDDARKRHFLSASAGLLKKIPVDHVTPLKKGGLFFFKGDRTVGGYYRAYSSSIYLNAGVHPSAFPIAFLHEMGHLVHFEVATETTIKKFTKASWFRIGPLRLRKFWKWHGMFFTPYSAISPEEDFAEVYAGIMASLFDQKEWLEIGFGSASPCPVCGAPWFFLDLEDDQRGICAACDALYGRLEDHWTPLKQNLARGRAEQEGISWTPIKPD